MDISHNQQHSIQTYTKRPSLSLLLGSLTLWWSRNLGQRFRNYKLRNYEKNQTRIQFSVQS